MRLNREPTTDAPEPMNAKITMKSGDIFLTRIDLDTHPIATLTARMNHGGTLVIEDTRWGTRTLIVQMGSVESIELGVQD